jgi:hypothetical protein
MQYEINETIKDRSENIRLSLNHDTVMSAHHVKYPITWKGTIGYEPIEIIQSGEMGSQEYNYEWKIFPEKYNRLRSEVVKKIDNYLRILD